MEKPISPSEAIRTRLNGRGWNQKMLAEVSGLHFTEISHLMTGRGKIRMAEAGALVKAFPETDVHFWLNIQKEYQLYTLLQERKGEPWKV